MGNWDTDGRASAEWRRRQLRALMDKECALINESNPNLYACLPRFGIAHELEVVRAQIENIRNEGQ